MEKVRGPMSKISPAGLFYDHRSNLKVHEGFVSATYTSDNGVCTDGVARGILEFAVDQFLGSITQSTLRCRKIENSAWVSFEEYNMRVQDFGRLLNNAKYPRNLLQINFGIVNQKSRNPSYSNLEFRYCTICTSMGRRYQISQARI
jgi:hypothetical protein